MEHHIGQNFEVISGPILSDGKNAHAHTIIGQLLGLQQYNKVFMATLLANLYWVMHCYVSMVVPTPLLTKL